MNIYLIGSLRNSEIPFIAQVIRKTTKHNVFDDWYAAGEHADDAWRDYEKQRGRSYAQALQGLAAEHTFKFDKTHLDRADAAVLVLPAGRSGHLELGYIIGKGKPGYILHDNPERWDLMYLFATGVYEHLDSLLAKLSE